MIVHGDVRRITADEYSKMAEAGIFDADERVELIDGILISYAPPQRPEHAGMLWNCVELIRKRLHGKTAFWSQMPLVLCDDTVLEPDLALLVEKKTYRRRLPRAADVHAVIEVAWSSLSSDRSRKLRVYAEAGIMEYWVVDVRNDRFEIYRNPCGTRYESFNVAQGSDSVSFAAFPDVAFSVDELLG